MRLQGGVFPADSEHRPSAVASRPPADRALLGEGLGLTSSWVTLPLLQEASRMLRAAGTGRADGTAGVRGQFASFVSVLWLLFLSVSQRLIKGPERMKYQTTFYSYLLIACWEFNLDTMTDIIHI